MQDYMNEFITLQNDYVLEFEAIGWNDILSPSRIQEDAGITENKFMIKRANLIVEKYRKKSVELLMNGTDRINEMDINPDTKKRLADGYNDGLSPALKGMNLKYDLEKKIVLEFDKIIDLLSKSTGHWKVRNNLVYFENDKDLNRFNACLKDIKKFSNEQQDINNASGERVKNNLERIKKKLD